MAHLIHPSSFPRDWLCGGLLFSWHEPGSSNFFCRAKQTPPRGSLRFDIPPSPGAWNAATRGGSWLSSGTFGPRRLAIVDGGSIRNPRWISNRVDDDGDVAWLERLDLQLLPGAVPWTFSCRLAPWPRRQASGASRLRFLAPMSAMKPPRPVVSPVPSAGLGRSLQSTADLRDDAGCRLSAAHRPGGLGFGACKASSVGLLLGMCPGRLLCDRRRPSVLFLGNDAYGRIHARGSRRGSEYGCPRRLVGIWLDF